MKLLKLLMVAAVAILLAANVSSQSYTNKYTVTLAWDASPGTNYITNYAVYWGPASRTYTNFVNARTNLTVSISNLSAVTTYYYAATAKDNWGLESDYSNEVTNTTPRPRPIKPSNLRTNF